MSADKKTPSVLQRVAELNDMDLSRLRERWRELFDSKPPSYGRTMMMKRLAYRIQEIAYGGLHGEVRDQQSDIRQILNAGIWSPAWHGECVELLGNVRLQWIDTVFGGGKVKYFIQKGVTIQLWMFNAS